MKKLLTILLISLGITSFGQSATDYFIVVPGEYVPLGLDITTSTPYYINANASAIPSTVSGNPGNVAQVIGGGHHAALITASGGLYTTGQNPSGALGTGNTTDQGSLFHVTRDSIGNTLDPVKQAMISGTSYGAFWWTGFVTTTGKLYVMGNTQGGNEGNGTYGCVASTRAVQVTATGNPYWVKIQGGYSVVALDSTGQVWTWGGNGYNYYLGQGNSPANYRIPNKITLPSGRRAIDIASNGQFSYAVLDNGHIMFWAQQYFEDYGGMYPAASIGTSAIDITTYLSPYLPTGWNAQVAQLQVGSNCTYLLLTTGSLYSWGGTPCGEAGIGQGLNYSTLVNPYFWDFGPHESQVDHPTRVAPGKSDFAHIYTGLTNSFYTYVDDTKHRLYALGRNKGGSIDNGIMSANQTNGNIAAYYPDSWNEIWIEQVAPASITVTKQTTSPYCILHPSGDTCRNYTIPSHSAPSASLGATYVGGQIVLDASGSHVNDGRYINHYLITQTSGPSTVDMGIQTSVKDTISTAGGAALSSGTYGFKLKIINDSWDSSFATASVVVGAVPPTVTAASGYSVILPISTGTLSGTVTANGGSVTITGASWAFTSGPATATVSSTSLSGATATAFASGMSVAGTYVFTLTGTDSNGNTNTATLTITVNSALPVNGYFIVKPFYKHIFN